MWGQEKGIIRQGKDGDYRYIDYDRKQKYSKICGGLAWPGKRHGAIVIVGQDLEPEGWSGLYAYHFLDDFVSKKPSKLVSHAIRLDKKYAVINWYTNLDDEGMMRIKRKVDNRNVLRFQSVKCLSDKKGFTFIQDTITNLIEQERLHFGPDSEYLGHLDQVVSDELELYPEVAALGYVLTELTIKKPSAISKIARQRDHDRAAQHDPLRPEETTGRSKDRQRNLDYNPLRGG